MTDSFAASITAWLLTYAIHSTVLLGMAWLVLRVRRAGPDVADLLWKVALVGGVVTATAQSLFDVRPAGSLALGEAPAALVNMPPTFGEVPTVEGSRPEVGTSLPATELGAGTPVNPATSGDAATSGFTGRLSMVGVIATAWLIVGIGLLAWYGGRRLILVGRLGDRRVLVDGELPAALAALRREAGVRRPIRLTASNAISSPVALGNGEICLPVAALEELEPAQQRAMLAHELAHLVRRDPQWLAFACAMERVFFFQPLNRVARRGLQEAAEYQADAWAAQRSGGVPLARCLVKVAEWIEASPLGVPVAGMAEQRSQLSVRVARLLEKGAIGAPRRQPLASMLSVGALAATTVLAPGVMGHRGAPEPASDPWSIPTDAELGVAGTELDPMESGQDRRWERTSEKHGSSNSNSSTNSNRNSDTNDGVVRLIDGKLGGGLAEAQRDTAVVRALMQRLKDEDAEVRQAAAYALGRIENPIAIPALVDALEDRDPEVRSAALDALSNFDRGVPAAPIRRMLGSDDAEVRQHAVHILAEMRDRESMPAIARMVADRDPEVRQAAHWALAEIGDPSSASAVAAGLADAHHEVRQAALEAMIELNGTIPDAALNALLQDRDADVRQSALHYVEHRRVASAVSQVVRMLDDPSSDVREHAAEALSEIRTTESHAALRRALNHADPKVRRIAVDYFGEEGES